jgi:hypothetical protein
MGTELHPALVDWLIAAGWSGDGAALVCRPSPRTLEAPAAATLAAAIGADAAAAVLRGARTTTQGTLRLGPGRLAVASAPALFLTVAEARERLAAVCDPVVAGDGWFTLERSAAASVVLAPAADNPARAVVIADGRADVVTATAAMAELERVHLHRPTAAHRDVVDVAAMATAAAGARRGLLDGQDEAVSALVATEVGAVLAAPPGAGKTVIAAVAIAETLSAGGRAVVAVPVAVMAQWCEELARWAPHVPTRTARDVAELRRRLRPGAVVVTGHDVAARWAGTSRVTLELVVVDEAAVLTGTSQRSAGLWAARARAERGWALTGTPSERRAEMAVADLVGWARGRARREVAPGRVEDFQPVVVGYAVRGPVPAVEVVAAPVTPTAADVDHLEAVAALATTSGGLAGSRARETIRRALGDPLAGPEAMGEGASPAKRTALVARVAEHCASGRSALVCTSSTRLAHAVAEELSASGVSAGVLDSTVSTLRRVAMLSAFSLGDLAVLVVTPASQRGVNLQRADLVAHLDLPATAALFAQRNARAARIGNSSERVEVWVPYLAGTWDARWVLHALESGGDEELDPLAVGP